MKYTIYIILLLSVVMLWNCSEDDPTLSDTPIAAAFLSPDSSYEYVFLEENADNSFETFTYTSADFGQQVVVNYVLEVDTLDGDFSSAQDVQSPVQTLYQAVSVNDFNLALAALGVTPEVQSTVQVRLRAYLDDPSEIGVYSDPINLIVTPFDASFPPIYAVGNGTLADWDPASSIAIKATTLTLYEGELELIADDSGDEPFSFRFLFQQEWGEDLQYSDFDLVETVPEGLLQEFVNGFGESNFQAMESGTYQFTINLDNSGNKTLKAVKQ